METEYTVSFPKQKIEFMKSKLTFSIGNIKSRYPSGFYFRIILYNMSDTELTRYTSPRTVIDTAYHSYVHTFTISDSIVSNVAYMVLELVFIGVSSENPAYFNRLMLNEGEYIGYHTVDEVRDNMAVGFNKSSYVNLYNANGNYLQVIRPMHDDISLKKLNASDCTVLCPHLEYESEIDNDINLYLEFINQRSQKIDVLR